MACRTRRIATLVALWLGVAGIAFAPGISTAEESKPGERATGSSGEIWMKETWRSAATLEEEVARARAALDETDRGTDARRALGVLSAQAAGALEAALALGRRDVVAQLEDLIRQRLSDTRPAVARLAESGKADALFALGLYDARGLLGQADRKRACESFSRAAKLGNVAGGYHAALCVLEADPERAAKLLQAAANAGHPAAQEAVGRACLGGQQSAAGSDCARIYVGAAAGTGRPSAQSLLGWMYATGTGVEKDYARSAALYTQAANAGDVAAQNNLGELYENGTGVPADSEQATRWYEKAAQAGFAPAQFNLGRVYAARASVVRALALKWLSRAHEQGVEPTRELIQGLKAQVHDSHGPPAAKRSRSTCGPSNSVASTAAPATQSALNAAILATVTAWAQAWSAKDVERYLAFYAPAFKPPRGQMRAAWEKQRRARIAGPRVIEVSISGVEVLRRDDARAAATFCQRYRSDRFQDSVSKTLELVRDGERWLIVEERVVSGAAAAGAAPAADVQERLPNRRSRLRRASQIALNVRQSSGSQSQFARFSSRRG